MVKSLCKNPELENLVCSGNKITRLDVSKNKKMKKLDVYNNSLKSLTIGGATALDEVECSRISLQLCRPETHRNSEHCIVVIIA